MSARLERMLKALLGVLAAGLAVFAAVLFAIPWMPAGARPWDHDAAAIRTLRRLAEDPRRAAELFADDSATTRDGLPVAERQGFCYRVFTRTDDGTWRAARWHEVAAATPAAWRCYAWPLRPNQSGKRTLFVDEHGVVCWRHTRGAYGGERAPDPDAALPDLTAGPRQGDGHRGRDGGLWQRIR